MHFAHNRNLETVLKWHRKNLNPWSPNTEICTVMIPRHHPRWISDVLILNGGSKVVIFPGCAFIDNIIGTDSLVQKTVDILVVDGIENMLKCDVLI